MEQYQYYLNAHNEVAGIRRISDGASIPLDPANTDYAAIMALVAEGKLTIAPAEGAN